jgi:hypothetical protein
MGKPQVIRHGALDMQVCVPRDWTDEQVTEFANREYFCGTELGWVIRKQGDRLLAGAPGRIECQSEPSHVHIVLDA